MEAYRIRQCIAAGHNFDGTAPQKEPEADIGPYKTYGEEDAGGEFTPGKGTLRSILLHGGNQSSAEFRVVYANGKESQLLVCPSSDRQVFWSGSVELDHDDKIVVITKHAEYAMQCDIICEASPRRRP